ncbi:MAG: ATP-binding cassette domain-containing protein [Oscillospiraceae bacterium]|nr:ATP-binding cassette domain-containing protein [Oscillospiraceae bacterium]
MGNSVMTMRGLCKSYKKQEVLHDFSLMVERGHICGLIGPNGAGKTTIMKILAGLMFPDKGELEYFGSPENLDDSRARMSFMIEQPIISGSMTARENLEYIRYLRGYPDEKRIDEILELVGLTDTGKKRAGKFSLGMKQRLGIGMALLPKPEVMVLDEPVNGLDPEGIVEVRQLIQRMQEEWGVTVLISSHLLSELSELCTDFSILSHGELIENLSREELLVKCRNHIALRTDDINKTAAVLEEKLQIADYKVIHGEEIHIFEQLGDIRRISRTLTDSGLIITKLNEEGQNLEDYYLEKVGGRHE